MLLWKHPRRIAEAATTLFTGPRSGVVAILILGVHVILATYFLSLTAALVFVTCGAALWLAAAAWKPAGGARGLLVSLALAVASTMVGLTLADVGIRLADLEHAGPDEAVAYDGRWQENALGFRSPYEVTAKDPETARVLALGDSFTWGVGVAKTADVWPARLEALLTERLAAARDARPTAREIRRVEVLNLGRPGFTTANEAELLRRVGWRFDPDLIVVQFYINDALPSGPDFFHESSNFLFPQRWLLPVRFRAGAIRHTALFRFIQKRYQELRNRNVTWDPLFQEGNDGWTQFSSALGEIGESARARGVPVLFAMFPRILEGEWTQDEHPDRGLYARIGRAAADSGLEVLDLTPIFAQPGVDGSRWWATRDDHHPNAAGHDLVARALASHIAEEWLHPWLGPVEVTGGGASGF